MRLDVSIEDANRLHWALRVAANSPEDLEAEDQSPDALLDLANTVADQLWEQRTQAKTKDEKTIILGLELIRKHPKLADPM